MSSTALSVGYDGQGELLYLKGSNLIECPYGINIDNGIIIATWIRWHL